MATASTWRAISRHRRPPLAGDYASGETAGRQHSLNVTRGNTQRAARRSESAFPGALLVSFLGNLYDTEAVWYISGLFPLFPPYHRKVTFANLQSHSKHIN